MVHFLVADIPCLAQPAATAGNLREAAYKAGLCLWTDAIEQYRRILETSGDDLVPVDPPYVGLSNLAGGSVYTMPWPSDRSLPARWICHEQICRFPAIALKQYRERADASANKRFEDAGKRRDDRALQQLLAESFCSSAGEDSLLLLAQRAFDRADFDSAERFWRMLLPRAVGLQYPQPKISPAAIRARLILLSLFRGDYENARDELKSFRSLHPDATGLLAGRDGKYVETLDGFLKDPQALRLPTNTEGNRRWAAFGGNSARNSHLTGPMPRYWPGPPTWKTAISGETGGQPRSSVPSVAPDHPRSLAFHPVIAGNRAFVADSMRIHSFDLMTGSRTTIFDLRKSVPLPGIDASLSVQNDVRYTLTYADELIYARLGAQRLRAPRADAAPESKESASAIVCLGPINRNKDDKIAMLWLLRPPAAVMGATVIFEGTPIVRDNRLYVLVWKQVGGEVTTAIACYRGVGQKEPPELIWQQEVGRPSLNPVNDGRTRHDLLTFASTNVVCCTNAGNVIALNAISGKPVWEYRYSRSEPQKNIIGRDLCPCLFDGKRIFAAPADSDRLLCIDAFDGRLLWDREGVDVVHLLGVSQGRLIATFAGPVKGIRGIDVVSGSETFPKGWTQHDGGGVATFGRGFVTPELVFWPTKHGLYFLRPEDGRPARQPIPGAFGNLTYADGCFVVATATEIWGFVSEGKLVEPRRKEIEKQPGNKWLIYRLGISEADAGNSEAALRHFDLLTAGTAELAMEAHRRAQTLRWKEAERLRTNEGAVIRYRQILDRAASRNDPVAHLAEMRLAEFAERERKIQSPLDRWRSILATSDGLLVNRNGHPRLLAAIARDALHRLGERDAELSKIAIPEDRPLSKSTAIGDSGDSRTPLRRARKLPPESVREIGFDERFVCCRRETSDPSELCDPPFFLNGKLSDFHRCGNRLYALYDSRALVAFDLSTGNVLWDHWAVSPRALNGEAAVTIRPFFHTGAQRLLLQLSSGRLRVVDARDGTIHHEMASSRRAWKADPIVLDEKTIVFPEDADFVTCVDLDSGTRLWRQPLPRPSSLIGNPPSLHYDRGFLIVGVERNQGMEIELLDLRTGRRVWKDPIRVGSKNVSLTTLDFDDQTLFLPTEEGLIAVSLSTGQRIWEKPISGMESGEWRVVCRNSRLLLFPIRPASTQEVDLEAEGRRSVRDIPTAPRITQPLAKSYHALTNRTIPLFVLDKTDGSLVQRMEFPVNGMFGEVRVGRIVTVVTDSAIWELTDR